MTLTFSEQERQYLMLALRVLLDQLTMYHDKPTQTIREIEQLLKVIKDVSADS